MLALLSIALMVGKASISNNIQNPATPQEIFNLARIISKIENASSKNIRGKFALPCMLLCVCLITLSLSPLTLQRLAEISTSLNDVFALPNSQQIWAVGNAGLIIHSTDGGES
jgi:hypothetical protein